MNTLKNRVNRFKNRLTSFTDDEPVNRPSFLVIILLDVFILSMVFAGLSDHTGQLTSPSEYLPKECRSVFMLGSWSEANKIDEIQSIVLTDFNNYSNRQKSLFERIKINELHPTCRSFFRMVNAITTDKELFDMFVRRQNLARNIGQLEKKFEKQKEVYETSLLATIANQNQEHLKTISNSIQSQSRDIERLKSEKVGIENQMDRNAVVKQLSAVAIHDAAGYRDGIKADYKEFEFWYPLKELGWQFLFIFPLFSIFFLWNIISINKGRSNQTLISTHLLVIASIPILFKIVETAINLIPKHFFKNLFRLLEQLKLIAVWHYLLIFVSVLLASCFLYCIQNKLVDKHRIQLKRITKGLCIECGKRQPADSVHCPICGTRQYEICPDCKKETFMNGNFCINCGTKS